MTGSETQGAAFLAQARSDFGVYRLLLADVSVHPCHWLHYLQMSTEKVAKAVLLAPRGAGGFRPTHVAFSKLTNLLRNQDTVAEALGMPIENYRAFIRESAGLRARIEGLSPAVAGNNGPNVEYPWEARDERGQARWYAPAEFIFSVVDDMRGRQGVQLLILIQLLLDRFERLF